MEDSNADPVRRYSMRATVCRDRKSTRLNSSHRCISYAVFCLKKNNEQIARTAKMNMIIHDDGHTIVVATDGRVPDDELRQKPKNQGFEYVFFFNDTATPEIYTLSLHAALPI